MQPDDDLQGRWSIVAQSARLFGHANGVAQTKSAAQRTCYNSLMPQLGKTLVLMGVALVLIGGLVWALGRSGFKGLPGNIRYESEGGSFYFSIVTCLVLSLLLTLSLWLWRWLSRG